MPLEEGAAKNGEFHLADHMEVVGVIEPDHQRVAAFNERFRQKLVSFTPSQWAQALQETRPETLLVTVPDYLHEAYIVRGLEEGLDIITEKPMVTCCQQGRAVLAAEQASVGEIKVAFNYRYNPVNLRIKEFIESGRLGRIVQVDLNQCLDTLHGASYFYRWNRQRRFSGSLAVHKCCHSFDLIRWFIGQEPKTVFAMGGLDYYGENSPHQPAGRLGNQVCPYLEKWFKGGERPHDKDHPIYDLQGDLGLPFPYQYPKRLGLYDAEIDIEDNYSALFEFEEGARMTFSVNFSSPWEGHRLSIAGELGRLEVQYYTSPARCPFSAENSIRFLPLFGGEVETLEWEEAVGAHGGADPRMLQSMFDPDGFNAIGRPLATSHDGMVAVAMGEAVWRSSVEKRQVVIEQLINGTILKAEKPVPESKV